jgi:hypothetical protein
MRADDGQPGSRLTRTIRHDGEDDPARAEFIDSLLLKYRSDQAAEKPTDENSSKRRRGLRLSPLVAR